MAKGGKGGVSLNDQEADDIAAGLAAGSGAKSEQEQKLDDKVAAGEHVDAIDAGRASLGVSTASGQEAARRSGAEDDKGDTHDEVVRSPDEPTKGDYLGEGQPPIGMQKEPAQFVSNGQIPGNMVASPSGLVPVSSVASTPEQAEKVMEQRKKDLGHQYKHLTRGKKLTDEQIGKMTGAELRAVGHDRGYKMSDSAGTRGTRAAFVTHQTDDKNLEQ